MACGCTTVGTLVQRVSRILNDDVRGVLNKDGATYPDTARWSYPVLIDFLNEGLSYMVALRPDAFTVTEVIRLKAGAKQLLPDEYDSIVTLLSNAYESADGSFVEGDSINEVDNKMSRKIDIGCSDKGGQKKVTGFAVDSHDSRSFTVEPPVPRGADVMVCGRFVKVPCQFTTADLNNCVSIPRKFDVPLVDWVLHRAYLIETESAFSSRASASALQRFYRAVSAGYLQESRFQGDQYLGKDEDMHDPNGVNKARGI